MEPALGAQARRGVSASGAAAREIPQGRRLVVEIDGAYHEQRVRADAARDAVLQRAGYRVLRFEAQRVEREIEAVVARIREEL